MAKELLLLQFIKSRFGSSILQLKHKVKNHSLEITRALSENIFILLLQYIGVTISILMPSPVWIAAGSAVGFMFLRGTALIFGIWFGTFIAYVLNLHAFIFACLCATIHTLQAWCIVHSNYWLKNPTLIFYALDSFLKCITIMTIISLMATFSIFIIFYNNFYGLTMLISWLANLSGTLLFSFTLVAWDMYFPDMNELSTKKLLKYILLSIIYCCLNFIAIIQCDSVLSCFLIALTFVLGLLISKTYGWYGLIFSIALFASLIILALDLGFIAENLKVFFTIQSIIFLHMIFGLGIIILRYNNKTTSEHFSIGI